MSTAGHAEAPEQRLNPFIFPSGTGFRFALLVVAVLGASLFIYNWLYFSVTDPEAELRVLLECAGTTFGGSPDFAAQAARNRAFEVCRAPAERQKAAWIAGGVVLLSLVAGGLYWVAPTWKIRRRRLVPLSGEDAPEVVACFEQLCREADLRRQPSLLWNPMDTGGSAVAFGRAGHHHIAVGGGLVTQFYADRPLFLAVVRHELAHLRNHDVTQTYLAVSIWHAFLLMALLPFAVRLVMQDVQLVAAVAWRVAAMAALVLLTRNAVLRAREFYADVRASTWDGPSGALRRVLLAQTGPKTGRWRGLVSVHPDPEARRRLLDDPDGLFRVGPWEALGAGLATAIALPSVETVLTLFATGTGLTAFTAAGAALLLAPLMAAVIGVGAWRWTFATRMRSQPPPRSARVGLALGAGLLLGKALSLETVILPTAGYLSGSSPGFTAAVLLLVAMLLFVRWAVGAADAWLEVAATRRSPRPLTLSVLTATVAVCAIALSQLNTIDSLAVGFSQAPEVLSAAATEGLQGPALYLAILLYVMVQPHTLALAVALWAFPLAAALMVRRHQAVATPPWAFLDAASVQRPWPRGEPFRLPVALRAGVVTGVVYLGVLLLLRAGVRLSVPEAVQATDGFRLGFFFAQVVMAVAMQSVAGMIVAAKVRRLPIVHGLFTAFVAAVLMTASIVGLNLAFGGTIDGSILWTTIISTVNYGALLTLPTAAASAAIAGSRRTRLLPADGLASPAPHAD